VLVARREELEREVEGEHAALNELKDAHAAAIDQKRAAHEQTLSSLHESVRARVAEKEQELQTVRDALETERLRSEHIERLCTKYANRTQADSAAAPAEARTAPSGSASVPARRPAAGRGARAGSSASGAGSSRTTARAASSARSASGGRRVP